MSKALIVKSKKRDEMPVVIQNSGANARYAYEEFFFGEIENPNTRKAYKKSVDRLLRFLEIKELRLQDVTPKMVREFIDSLADDQGRALSIPSKKQALAALRHFFDIAVVRHAIVLNPALSVRGPKYSNTEGKTPEISVKEVRKLISNIDSSTVVGKRDLLIISIMVYTGARVGAVANLLIKNFYRAREQYFLRFLEKGGKSREIPVRHDLQELLLEFLTVLPKSKSAESPLFRTAFRRTDRLSGKQISAIDICRMVKRRLKDANLPTLYSPHSFRVTVATDLLEQGVDIKDVQYLLGHADPRTTSIYDRRQQRISRNIVERISV
jgi:site-specific recombinase XerD